MGLKYTCPWPLGGCIAPFVVTSAYSVIFGFLLRMKVARHSIDLCWFGIISSYCYHSFCFVLF